MIFWRQSPDFWWKEASAGLDLGQLLAPLGHLYGGVAGRRMRRSGARAPIPVLCIGNLVVGGAGKTPMTLALARRLAQFGENPWILTRGYRSKAEHGRPVRVDLAAHRAAQVGDEALLLARAAPTLASADRLAAARLAARAGASVVVLDDGLQNPRLEKDFRLVVVDAAVGVGNGLCFPAGPLRAPLAAQLERASAFVIVGEGAGGKGFADAAQKTGKPVLHARLTVPAQAVAALSGRRLHAFAGIGRPEKFFATLAEIGAEIVGKTSFPDHYAYRHQDIAQLQDAARRSDAVLVTTEKDLVRLNPWTSFVDPHWPPPVAVPVEMSIVETGPFDALLAAALRSARARADAGENG